MINPKVGDVLVYKSEAHRLMFIEAHKCNKEIDESYNDGFVVNLVDIYNLEYEINNLLCIYESELKYFKIKEEKMLKPDDIISVEMTALEACKLRTLMAQVACGTSTLLHSNLEGKFKYYIKGTDLESSINWCNSSALHKADLAQFKDPKQGEIDALEKVINDAAAKLAGLKSGK